MHRLREPQLLAQVVAGAYLACAEPWGVWCLVDVLDMLLHRLQVSVLVPQSPIENGVYCQDLRAPWLLAPNLDRI